MDRTASDPLPSFCFKVVFGTSGGDAFFKSVGGLRIETEVLDVRAGGNNGYSYKLPAGTKWSNLVLKQGFTQSASLLKWRLEWMNNLAAGKALTRMSVISVIQLNTALKPIGQWDFKECWPVKWDLSDLDASKSELAIETLEIAHHGMVWKQSSAG